MFRSAEKVQLGNIIAGWDFLTHEKVSDSLFKKKPYNKWFGSSVVP